MKHSTKMIASIIATVATVLIGVAGGFLGKDYNYINLGVSIIIIIGMLWVLSLIVIELIDRNIQLNNLNSEIEQKIKRIEHLESQLSVSPNEDVVGNNFLYMALTQHPAEPLKLSMLEKSVEHGNVIAALILANIYAHGIESDGEIILKSDRNKAYEIYKKICDDDLRGVSDWMIGFYYQNNYIREAQICDKETRLKVAQNYFIRSDKKGFPKAKNSLGKLINDRALGFDPIKNESEMITYYENASVLGDNYANINLGNFYLNRYYIETNVERLESAKKQFESAAKMNSPEALIKLGTIYIELYNLEPKDCYIKCAQENFEASISFGANQFAAAGYFLLGNLLKQYPDLVDADKLKEIIKCNRFNDLIVECHFLSYEIFNDLILKGKHINGENRRYFDLLSQSFKNIEINPLKFQLKEKFEKANKSSNTPQNKS